MARLRMTNADYVAIAVSPALIMALVGSLVFFLIEVLYVGSYEIRLNYVFALFVFATVLIARIAIEFGSERAAMFSLPLGILVYLALMRFVEHPGPFSWLVNLALLAVVWWCAHKLTWDCTLIDDNEDASGEGLLGRVGLDETELRVGDAPPRVDNELFQQDADSSDSKPSLWQRIIGAGSGPHTPGVWVLYFSLAALPLFGIGQHWIPPAEVGRRRYAFGLLAIYVAAALSLLVTTSFLGLRRYLRQRRVEMPTPMAATWVSLGVVLILLVMFTAALLPRPNAEYAISQPPWQAAAPGDLQASRYSLGEEGTDDPTSTNRVTSERQEGPLTEETGGTQDTPSQGEVEGEASQPNSQQSTEDSSAQQGNQASSQAAERSGNSGSQQNGEGRSGSDSGRERNQAGQAPESNETDSTGAADEPRSAGPSDESGDTDEEGEAEQGAAEESSAMSQMFEHSESPAPPLQLLETVSTSLGNLLKLLFYAILTVVIVYFAWTRRQALRRALADILRQLQDFWARLFGRGATAADGSEASDSLPIRRRSFREFSDPFATGRHRSMPPAELVRYTFEAFEAWAGDRGRLRTADQTPMELVRGTLPPQSPMYTDARQLVQLYNEAAYSAGDVPREAADRLQALWQMMRASAATHEPRANLAAGASARTVGG